jgi:hypothetical protein
MKTIAEYQADMNQADRVRRLLASKEFETIVSILKRMKDRDIESLMDKENPEARFRIKCFKDILDEIEADVQRGEIAATALKEGTASDSPSES